MAKELDGTMEIAGDGEQVEIAKLLCKSLPFEFPTKRKSQKSAIVERLSTNRANVLCACVCATSFATKSKS
jgi:hypothetical protein